MAMFTTSTYPPSKVAEDFEGSKFAELGQTTLARAVTRMLASGGRDSWLDSFYMGALVDSLKSDNPHITTGEVVSLIATGVHLGLITTNSSSANTWKVTQKFIELADRSYATRDSRQGDPA